MTIWAARTTNIPVSFDKLRKMWLTAPMQEGVVNAGDLKVSQRAAGANMSVDVAPGQFWVRTDIDTPDGLVPGYSDAIGNFAVAAAHATLPRIDALYLQYNDSALGAGAGGDTPTFRLLTGTATAGAQATNFAGANYRAGAPAPPNDALLIADIAVPAAAGSITNANIVDRRPWARGAFFTKRSGGILTATGLVNALETRVECSGAPLKVTAKAIFSHSAASVITTLRYRIDGADPAIGTGGDDPNIYDESAATIGNLAVITGVIHPTPPSAGSHLLQLWWQTASGTATSASAGQMSVTFEEIVRPVASND